MNTSKYYLKNARGSRIDLNVEGNVHFINVEGLGTSSSHHYADIDNGFFSKTKTAFSQEQIVGDFRFMDAAFETYRALVDFIQSAEELFIVYCPYGVKEYYRRVELRSLKKERRDENGVSLATAIFACLTPWFLAQPVELEFSDSTEQKFRYNVTPWDGAPFASNFMAGFSASVSNDGHLEADVEIEYIGAAENPKITLADESNNILGRCNLTYNFVSGDRLKLSTKQNDSFVRLYRGNQETDLMPYIDLTTEPFFRIPVGKSCHITIESATLSGTATVKIYSYYRSV